jgi:hypothetical protein
MRAYKFLLPDRIGVFSGARWPAPGEWLEVGGPLGECRNGIHACRVGHLPYWLSSQLWEVELDGEIVETDLKLVARRGCLRAHVAAWNDAAQRSFAEACVRRTAGHAVDALAAAGRTSAADRLASALDLAEVAAAADAASADAVANGAHAAAQLAELAGEAAQALASEPASVVAYVAAYAADLHASSAERDAFATERAEQARWFRDELGVDV